ncbi:MAG TPA: hypothetical protein VF207_00745, partial [Chthoniobacterales bacterium]
HILRVLIILNDPACKIISCVEVRQKDLIKLAHFLSHYLVNFRVRQFIPEIEIDRSGGVLQSRTRHPEFLAQVTELQAFVDAS